MNMYKHTVQTVWLGPGVAESAIHSVECFMTAHRSFRCNLSPDGNAGLERDQAARRHIKA